MLPARFLKVNPVAQTVGNTGMLLRRVELKTCPFHFKAVEVQLITKSFLCTTIPQRFSSKLSFGILHPWQMQISLVLKDKGRSILGIGGVTLLFVAKLLRGPALPRCCREVLQIIKIQNPPFHSATQYTFSDSPIQKCTLFFSPYHLL